MEPPTRSRYGTRMLLDLAQHYNQGPVQVGDIATVRITSQNTWSRLSSP